MPKAKSKLTKSEILKRHKKLLTAYNRAETRYAEAEIELDLTENDLLNFEEKYYNLIDKENTVFVAVR